MSRTTAVFERYRSLPSSAQQQCEMTNFCEFWRMLRKAISEKILQNMLKFSECGKSIQKQIRPSYRKIVRPHFVFVWFREI